MNQSEFISIVTNWINNDPDQKDSAELTELLDRMQNGDTQAKTELEGRFAQNLQFGTAGLRGAMRGGPNRMNTAVVRRAAYGLVMWLREYVGEDANVVIGFDARHRSADFARDTAAIVQALNANAYIMPRALPTPVLAYAVRELNADAGVMVTASHNPAADNGYKVYLGGRATSASGRGVQIVPPVDAQIAAHIATAPAAKDIPLGTGWRVLGDEIAEGYASKTIAELPDGARKLSIVYTAMHGVGGDIMLSLFNQAGFSDVTVVDSQIRPDPDFPTVAFPNPEEENALDEALRTASAKGADLIIASDPDADRCSVAIPTDSGWRQLTGDEIGTILGEYAAKRADLQGRTGTFASSIVSSQMLKKIAQVHNLNYVATLTGFKWIARVPEILYGYEEAIGFCVNPTVVRDKDGISAGLAIAGIAAELATKGLTLQSELDRLAVEHGVHVTAPVTVRVNNLALIDKAMEKLRQEPPTLLGDEQVSSVEDLSQDGTGLPPTNALRIFTDDGNQLIVRPSGTEPKIKCYLEVIVPVISAEKLPLARNEAAARMERFRADVRNMLNL